MQNNKHQIDKFKALFETRAELEKETDRGCCLMAAALLDEELRELLSAKLVGSKKLLDELFTFNGPLGTFSARIKLSYSLGLISKMALNDLEIIRKVRNEFGHQHKPISFNTAALKVKIGQLQGHLHKKINSEPRKIFVNCVIGLVAQIHNALVNAPGFKELPNPLLPSEEVMNNLDRDPVGTASAILDKLFKGGKL